MVTNRIFKKPNYALVSEVDISEYQDGTPVSAGSTIYEDIVNVDNWPNIKQVDQSRIMSRATLEQWSHEDVEV